MLKGILTMNSIATKAINTLATSVLLCLSFTAQAQYNPNGGYQGNTGSTSPDWQTSAAGAAAAAFSAASAGMNAANNAAASYQQNASAQFLQSSAPVSSFGQSGTGYTNDGTLMMGGNKIGNPHQILHDAQASSLFGITAVRYTFTDVPTYGQGTLAQIQTDMTNAPISNDPTRLFSRLYLTATNPYTQGVATPHNNYQTYQGVVADAQAGSYQLTVADDNKLYAFKTLSAPNQQAMNILIKELPNTSQFKGSTDLKGGATGVHVTQSGDAAALQNYLATVKPYDFSWRSAMGAWADGNARPSNITAELGQFGNMPISNNEAGAVFANWVQGSSQVQTYQANLQNQSAQSGNEAFGVLAWDANQNRYVMLDPTNTQATAGSVSGNMPTLGDNQFGFFGMHTHGGSATPSGQDYLMTQQLGLDQLVVGMNGTQAIFTNNPSNNWQGKGFEFEDSYISWRPLNAPGNSNYMHGYTVYGASYPGDKNATVVSYGPSGNLVFNGNLIRHAPGTTINKDDRKHWESLYGQPYGPYRIQGPYKLLVDKDGRPVSDQKVEDAVKGMDTYLMYNPTEYNYFGPNSNTPPGIIGTNAGAVNVTIPAKAPGQDTPLTGTVTEDSSDPESYGGGYGSTY